MVYEVSACASNSHRRQDISNPEQEEPLWQKREFQVAGSGSTTQSGVAANPPNQAWSHSRVVSTPFPIKERLTRPACTRAMISPGEEKRGTTCPQPAACSRSPRGRIWGRSVLQQRKCIVASTTHVCRPVKGSPRTAPSTCPSQARLQCSITQPRRTTCQRGAAETPKYLLSTE